VTGFTPLRLDEPVDRRPPYNAEAEQRLLGILMIENRAFDRVRFVRPEYFGNILHGRIFEAVQRLIADGMDANPVTLKNLFDQDEALAETGGAQYLATLVRGAVTISNAEDYGRVVVELAQRRAIIAALQDGQDSAYTDHRRSADEILTRLKTELTEIGRAARWTEPEWDAGEDLGEIPPRHWLLGNIFCRRFVSSLIADGGVGKTAVRIAQLLALATGRPLTGEHVFQRSRVLYLSLEDDRDELRRRVKAAMLHHGVSAEEVRGWFFLTALGSSGWKLAITENGEHKTSVLQTRLVEVIRRRRIDVVCLDPFVKSHAVEENANNAIDFVAGILAEIATENDCAVDAPHHVNKGLPDPGNANRGRGASAFKDAGRLVYTLTPMSDDEAKLFDIEEDERRRLVRMDNAKVNIAPRPVGAKWFKLVGVPLGNRTDLYPIGDEVQTVEPWTPPDMWAGLSTETLNTILNELDRGLPNGRLFTNHAQAVDRAAWRVVQKSLPHLTDVQAREFIRTWVKNEVLCSVEYDDEVDRKTRKGLRVNNAKRPG
jgi:RecA-family ATPase